MHLWSVLTSKRFLSVLTILNVVMITWDGTERLAPQYEILVLYDDGPGYGAITKGKVGLYDGQGNEVFPAILDDVYYADMRIPWGVIREQKTEFPLLSRIKRK